MPAASPSRAAPLLRRGAEEVALAGYRGLMAGRAYVVPGWPNRIITTLLPRLLPRAFLANQMAKVQR